MNIEKGGGRLVTVISWTVTLCIWMPGLIFLPAMEQYKAMLMGFVLVVGTLAGLICSRIGHWVIDGFLDD